MKKLLLIATVLWMGLVGAFAQNTCNPPFGLTATGHLPNWQNIALNWNAPADTTAVDILWSSRSMDTRIGLGDMAAVWEGAIRFETSDLTNYSGYALTAVSFIPGEALSVCTYTIKVWQGGSFDGTDYDTGTLIDSQLVSGPLNIGVMNTILLNDPVTIDPTQELWIGISCNQTSGYPLSASNNGAVNNKGDLIGEGGEWMSLDDALSGGNTGYNWVIVGTLSEISNIMAGYNVYRNSVLLTPTPIPSTSYLDSVANGDYLYDVTAQYANNCESDPISVAFTMADNPCFDCMDSVTIGITSSQSYMIPINTYYNYSYTQQIYDAAELGSINGRIPCISLQYIYTSSQSKDLVIYMGNTSKSTFSTSSDWIPVEQMQPVFQGTVDFVPGMPDNWINIPLSTPFEWDGSSNLVIAILNNTGSYVSSSNATFNVHAATNKTLYVQNDGAAYNPAASFSGTVGTQRSNIRFMVGEPIVCPMPSHYTATGITHESANLSWWSHDSDNAYEIVVVPEGSTLNNETPIVVNDTFYTVTGLTENTTYTIYMRAQCTSENSSWLQQTIHTDCLPVVALPYTENFNSYTAGTGSYLYCWRKIANGSFPYIIADPGSTNGNSLYFYSYAQTPCYAILPAMDETINIAELQIEFDARIASTSYGNLEIGVMEDPADPSTFVAVKTLTSADFTLTNQWTPFIAYFSDYTGTGKYIAFRSPGNYTTYTYIDNVNVNYLSGCGRASNLTVSNVSGASARISWTPGEMSSESDIYNLEYAPAGDESAVWTTLTLSDVTSYLLTGLEPHTMYNVRLFVTCDEGIGDTLTASFITPCLVGGDIVIEGATSTTSYFPTYTFYNYSYTQQIYPASAFNGANSFFSIAFNCQQVNTPTRNLDIYLMHTTETSISSWLPVTNAVKVFSGNVTFTTGWNTITFDTIFNYNGTDNLVLIVDDNTGSYSTANYCYSHTGESGCSRYIYQDGANYDPNNITAAGTSSSTLNDVKFGGDCDSLITCVAPNVLLENITSSSAGLIWAPGYQESSWEIEYRLASDTEWTSAGTVTETQYTLTNLLSNNDYEVRLRSVCDNENSAYTTLAFTTECDAITTLPFAENFDAFTSVGADVYPDCWKRMNNYTTSYPYVTSSYAHSGEHSLYLTNGGSAYYTVGALPVLDESIAMNNLMVSMYTYCTSSSYYFEVGIMSDPDDASTFEVIGTVHPTNINVWELKEFFTDEYTGNGHHIAIRCPMGSSCYYYIDDISISVIPTCMHVYDLTTESTNENSATISWTTTGDESEWQVVILPTSQATNVNPDTCSILSCTETTYTFNNLEPSTNYTVFVRANCNAYEQSTWMSIPFYTNQIPAQLPFNCDFENGANGFSLLNDIYTNAWVVGNATQNGGSQALYISADNGATNTYNITSAGCVWAFRDIYFPANNNGYSISFDWQAQGESTYDYMVVCLGDPAEPETGTSLTIPAGATQFTTNTNSSMPQYFNLQSTYTTFSTTLPGFSNDCVKRIYFGWRNDGSVGTNPPAAIDNLYIAAVTCPTPTNVATNNITTNSAVVSWTENGTATSWTVQYKSNDASSWTDITNASNPTTLTGLTQGTVYMVRVAADCGNGEFSPLSSTSTFTTNTPCETPTNLTATNVTATSITVSWTPSGSESAWNLQYRTVGGSWSNNIGATTSSHTFNNLTAATAYEVRVQAACGTSSTSDWLTGTFTTDEAACPTPTNFHVTEQTGNSATLAWNQEPGTATEWTINYKLASDATWTNVNVSTNPFVLTDLTADVAYQAQIIAHCANGNSEPSATISFTLTGINDYLLENSVSLIPNPATNFVDVVVNNDNIIVRELQVYDVYGRLMETLTVDETPIRIDLSNYAAGMYMVRIVSENGMANKSFIKR